MDIYIYVDEQKSKILYVNIIVSYLICFSFVSSLVRENRTKNDNNSIQKFSYLFPHIKSIEKESKKYSFDDSIMMNFI